MATFVRVLYDFDYPNSSGVQVYLKQDDVFHLIEKSNVDWWKVKRHLTDKKSTFVPANYVEEIEEADIPLIRREDGATVVQLPNNVSSTAPALSSSDEQLDVSVPVGHDVDKNYNTKESHDANNSQINDEVEVRYANLPYTGRAPPQEMVDGACGSKSGSVEQLYGEDNQPIYANMDIETSLHNLDNPPPCPSSESEVLKQHDGWEMHRDPVEGKPFYYQPATGQTKWGPPPGFHGNLLADIARRKQVNQKRISLPPQMHLPAGWRQEMDEQGIYFVHESAPSEKWLSELNKFGQRYYYKASGGPSCWALPQIGEGQGRSSSVGHEPGVTSPTTEDGATPPTLPSIPADGVFETQHPPQPPSQGQHYGHSAEDVHKPPLRATLSDSVISQHGTCQFKQNADKYPILISNKKGNLNRCKVLDNGKKLRKSWSPGYVVYKDKQIFVYKDFKAAAARAQFPYGKPESVLPLIGANVEFLTKDKDKSIKKSSLQVTTCSNTQYLFTHDDHITIHDWYIALSNNAKYLTENVTEEDLSTLKLSGKDRLKSTSDSNSSTLERLDEAPQAEKAVKIKDVLRKFFLKRPALESLKESGIYVDGSFGSTLQVLYDRDKCSVPRFVSALIAAIERRGLDIDGIYRINGNLAMIQKLRLQVDCNDKTLDYDSPMWETHVLTGALKLFFRELREPLFPSNLFDKFQEALKLSRGAKIKSFKELIRSMPKPNRDTMKELFRHLVKVTSFSRTNRMLAQNVAIVFGPTLLAPPVDNSNMAVTMVIQNQIVEFMLLEYSNLF